MFIYGFYQRVRFFENDFEFDINKIYVETHLKDRCQQSAKLHIFGFFKNSDVFDLIQKERFINEINAKNSKILPPNVNICNWEEP
jgi:hypothetical protein